MKLVQLASISAATKDVTLTPIVFEGFVDSQGNPTYYFE